jgi:hypothetical protein
MKKTRALPDAIAKSAVLNAMSLMCLACVAVLQLLMTEWPAFAEAVLSSTEEGKY